MMNSALTTEDELLIQRCVDDELSSDELRRLLSRMDELPSAWKTLACALLEERRVCSLIGGVHGGDAHTEPATEKAEVVQTDRGGFRSSSGRHWFSHPLTTAVLCVCVAFLSGLVLRPSGGSPGSAQPLTADLTMPTAADRNQEQGGAQDQPAFASLAGNRAEPDFRVQLPASFGLTDGSIELPVYSDVDPFVSEFGRSRQQSLRSLLEQQSGSGSGNVVSRFISIPLENGRVIVVPVDEVNLGSPIH